MGELWVSFESSKVDLIPTHVAVLVYLILARARPAVPLGLWSITSSLRGNLYVPRLHKFIKWFADNDVAHRN